MPKPPKEERTGKKSKNRTSAEIIREALNYHLRGKNIVVLDVEETDKDFHARFSAEKRVYLYRILNRRAPPVLRQGKVWHVGVSMDVAAMKKAAKHLVGKHDFTSFRDSECQSESPIKTLDKVEVKAKDDEIHITVEAKSFLHHMVRNIAGTLQLVGAGKWQPEDVKKALKAKDRTAAGPTAPACGLYFMRVEY